MDKLKNIEILDLLNAASAALVIVNDKGVIFSFNKEFIHLFQNIKENSNIVDIDGCNSSAFGQELLKALMENTEHYTTNVIHKDGYNIHFSFKPIQKDLHSSFFLCTVSKEYFKENNAFLQQLINNISQNIFIKDKKGHFLLANNSLAKVMGAKSSKEIIGKTDFDFYPKELAKNFRMDEKIIVESDMPVYNKQEKILSGGEFRWYSTTKTPFYDSEGRTRGIMGISSDITHFVKKNKALKKAKIEAEKADKLKSTFLANLSHEIRTPLNGIIGFSQFLRQKNIKEDKQKKYLDIINNNGQQLLMLINDILDISMIESNQIIIKNSLFPINPALEQLRTNFEHLAKESGKDVKVLFCTDLPDGKDKLFSDMHKINQIFNNLLVNSIKFTSKGEIELGYTVKNDIITFYVKDSGIGIAPKEQKEIFNRFRQVDDSATRNYGGTGLGLAISKGLTKLLGGKIWVESEKNKGATFYFTIPYVNSIDNKIQPNT